jgi:hypothetical protein
MTELRLHRELYDGPAVEEAVKTFGRFGTLEQVADPAHFVVRVTCKTPPRERQVSRELSNFALGLTVKGRKSS